MKNIILCCGQNGTAVIYGQVEDVPTPGDPVALKNARMVLYWASACGGLLGLAAKGPRGDTRITHEVPSILETVWQEVVEVSPEAVKAMDKWPAC